MANDKPPAPPQARAFDTVLQRAEMISPLVRALFLELPGIERFDFTPGQFITLLLPLPELGEESKRSYSIASSPNGTGLIELAVTHVVGGPASTWLHEIPAGTRIPATGPHGFFTMDKPPDADMCFVATGTGVTPIRPMLHRVFEVGTTRQMTLFFGCRFENDILYRAEFEGLAAKHANFRFVPTLSRAPDSWKGARGYVQTHLQSEFIDQRRTDVDVYVCGLSRMVEDVRARLKGAGWVRQKIHQELYD